ncbi:MAG: DUF3943 domain-containing protein [Burkholderiaceae bacterium]|nr:MAG: DUF3943 domain-containing protein [Burkholderiaceae bacterium]
MREAVSNSRFRIALVSMGCMLGLITPHRACAADNSSLPKLAEIESSKSYAIPAAEILGYDFLLNQFNRHFIDDDYKSNLSTIRHNLRNGWVVDNDPFKINQFLHPYQGSMYHGFARSAGLNYWESLGYSFAGSAAWEIAGERTPPSKNDQIATGVGGTFLGEALFRMANLVLERSDMTPFWRETTAAVISPSMGFNRLAFGDRFKPIFASGDPAYFARLHLGLSGTLQNEQGNSTQVKRNEVLADFSMEYGLPGKPGYTYTRPFDYFSFQTTGSSANIFENIMVRGLLVGTDYAVGNNYRGVWGFYGSYDYISPQIFRISTTALSLGTTAQCWLSDAIVLQGTGMLGLGYSAVGTMRGTSDQDYHYGRTPQALLALRLILGERASLDLTARDYFVGGVAGKGYDNIARVDLSFTLRVHQQHAISLRYLWSRRDASYPNLADQTQTRGTIGIYYTLLSHQRFGTVDWR